MFQRVGAAAYKPGLQTTLNLLDSLGNPHHSFKSIHIAGTNGKGSSSHMLAAVLSSHGYKTGLYTSPHLKDFRERIRINGESVSEQFVVEFIHRVKPQIELLSPSFFELTVAMAFCYFKEKEVDWVVVEVGMGGRLDSTNVIHPRLCLITQIGFDHMEFLGDTLPKIAYEKAGIIKRDVPVVLSETQEETKQVFQSKAQQESAPIIFADAELEVVDHGIREGIRSVTLTDSEGTSIPLELDLLGIYQLKNIKGVWQSLEVLHKQYMPLNTDKIREALRNVSGLTGLKGRWQLLGFDPIVVCDTAHNAAGVKEILAQVRSYTFEKLHIVWGMVADKERTSILTQLPQEAIYYFCEPSVPRGLSANILKEESSFYGLYGNSHASVNEALKYARQNASSKDFILVGGSNFVVAEIDDL
jgi:dihydrofolate synthase/folylpolyglutamate synthase